MRAKFALEREKTTSARLLHSWIALPRGSVYVTIRFAYIDYIIFIKLLACPVSMNFLDLQLSTRKNLKTSANIW